MKNIDYSYIRPMPYNPEVKRYCNKCEKLRMHKSFDYDMSGELKTQCRDCISSGNEIKVSQIFKRLTEKKERERPTEYLPSVEQIKTMNWKQLKKWIKEN